MSGGIIHGDFSSLGKNEHEKSNQQQDVGRRKESGGAGDPFLLNDVRYGRLRNKGDREEHDHEDRLRQKSHHARSACSHRSIRISGINRGECGKEAAKRQEEASRQHVAHESECQRIIGQYRNQAGNEQGDHKDQVRSEAKDPCRFRRNDFVFVEELPEVPIRLKDVWSALALDILFEPAEHAGVQRRKADHEQKLNEVVHNGP